MARRLVSRYVNDGRYLVNDDYMVERTADGWRWHDGPRGHGGAWQRTKHGAMDDLRAYLVMHYPTLAEWRDGPIHPDNNNGDNDNG